MYGKLILDIPMKSLPIDGAIVFKRTNSAKLLRSGLKPWHPSDINSDSMDGDQQRLALGAKGGHKPKGRNLTRERIAQVLAANPNPRPIRPTLPQYEAATTITLTWTMTEGVIEDVFKQEGEICVSVCSCRLLQAEYNRNRNVAEHLRFSIEDLDKYIRGKTKSSVVHNLNRVFKYANRKGLLKSSGRINEVHGMRICADFFGDKVATQDVYRKIEERPIAICINSSIPGFSDLGDEIYEMSMSEDEVLDHAVLVVAKGHTTSNENFLVIQNSWGEHWGNGGYARIKLKPDNVYQIFWVERVRDR